MRVLLIDPKGANGINIGLGYIGAQLIRKGHEVRVLDFNNLRTNQEERLLDALNMKPEIIGLSVNSLSLQEGIRIASICKSRNKEKSLLVTGGVGVTINPYEFLEKYSEVIDFAIFGEGEITFCQLIDSLAGNNCLEKIEGLVYKDGKSIKQNQERPLIKDLDRLPFPGYTSFDSQKKLSDYPIITSRGCPFKCIFCLHSQLSRQKWRPRSPKNVIEELKYAKQTYQIERFEIWDDNFALDINRAIDICNQLIAEALGLKYSLPSGIRAASITPELAEMLKKSGCTMVSIGVEDGNPETFPYVNKGENFEDIERGIKLLQNANLPVRVSMIIGLPHTTYSSTLKSMEFVKRMGVRANWYLPVPFPQTSLHQWVCQNGRFIKSLDDIEELAFQTVFFDTPEFTEYERYKAYYIANMEYSFPEKTPALIPYEPLYYVGHNAYERIINSFIIVWKYNKKYMFKHFLSVSKRLIRAFKKRVNHLMSSLKT